ncbi:hypothetical protein COLO4_17792 [Corchorus olitorius]|uniref:HTH-type transcriptional regulator protein ptxE n=1 Tax=Corchorus olitorius TaxID=93759 RepID=A0A1R3JBH9_9ROSI|nr:hypothetical protein COLO4_17792 [Corchorus olitorius]
MGICNSCESTSVVTAKLILQDGRLQEFPNPIKVSKILERNPNCFICSSDDMDFDTILSAIDEEDQLQLGELYFALPLSWLNSPLGTEEMGALAIRASQALKMGGGGGSGIKKKFCGCGIMEAEPLLLQNKRVANSSNLMAANGGHSGGRVAIGGGGGGGFVMRRKTRGAARRRPAGRSFTAKLTVILEEQVD